MQRKKPNTDELIACAVLWWTKGLVQFSCTDIDREIKKNGDLMALYDALFNQDIYGKINETTKRFVKILTKYLKNQSKLGGITTLRTHHVLEWPLSGISDKAELNEMQQLYIPQKTITWINFDDLRINWHTFGGSDGELYPNFTFWSFGDEADSI